MCRIKMRKFTSIALSACLCLALAGCKTDHGKCHHGSADDRGSDHSSAYHGSTDDRSANDGSTASGGPEVHHPD